jgi:hypothetical protein
LNTILSLLPVGGYISIFSASETERRQMIGLLLKYWKGLGRKYRGVILVLFHLHWRTRKDHGTSMQASWCPGRYSSQVLPEQGLQRSTNSTPFNLCRWDDVIKWVNLTIDVESMWYIWLCTHRTIYVGYLPDSMQHKKQTKKTSKPLRYLRPSAALNNHLRDFIQVLPYQLL